MLLVSVALCLAKGHHTLDCRRNLQPVRDETVLPIVFVGHGAHDDTQLPAGQFPQHQQGENALESPSGRIQIVQAREHHVQLPDVIIHRARQLSQQRIDASEPKPQFVIIFQPPLLPQPLHVLTLQSFLPPCRRMLVEHLPFTDLGTLFHQRLSQLTYVLVVNGLQLTDVLRAFLLSLVTQVVPTALYPSVEIAFQIVDIAIRQTRHEHIVEHEGRILFSLQHFAG